MTDRSPGRVDDTTDAVLIGKRRRRRVKLDSTKADATKSPNSYALELGQVASAGSRTNDLDDDHDHGRNHQEQPRIDADAVVANEQRNHQPNGQQHPIDISHTREKHSSSTTQNGADQPAGATVNELPPPPSRFTVLLHKAVSHRYVSWIAPKVTSYDAMKPVIRCAVSAWLGFLFLLIRPTEAILGQAGFFALTVACICPPSGAFIQTVEQNFYLFFYVSLSWAWCVLATFIANEARTDSVDPDVLQANEDKFSGLEATNPQSYARALIFAGTYLQPGPSAICIVFLGLAVAFFAWYKMHTVPSPWTFALVLACVLADVSLTIVPLFPTPYYTSGLLFMLPMSIQCGLHILTSIFVFPQSVSSAFVNHLRGVINPLADATELLEKLFKDDLERHEARRNRATHTHAHHGNDLCLLPSFGNGDEITATEIEEDLASWAEQGKLVRAKLVSSVAGLRPLKSEEHYLTKELTYGRLAGEDLVELSQLVQVLQLRSGGITFFFDVVSQAISHSHLNSLAFEVRTPAESRGASRAGSIAPSRRTSREIISPRGSEMDLQDVAQSHEHETTIGDSDTAFSTSALRHESSQDSQHRNSILESPNRPQSIRLARKVHLHALWPQGHHSSLSHGERKSSFGQADRNSSHHSLFESLRKIQQPVGIYESQRYMNVEREQNVDAEHVAVQLGLLAEASLPLVEEANEALRTTLAWLKRVNQQRSMYRGIMKRQTDAKLQVEGAKSLVERADGLDHALHAYRTSLRFKTMEPYLHLFDPSHPPSDDIDYRKLPHRALFWDCLATYHLMEFTGALLATMRKMQQLDERRPRARFWWPKVPLIPIFGKRPRGSEFVTEDAGSQEEDPEQGTDDDSESEHAHLGAAKRRNPDVQPYGNPWLDSLRYVDKALSWFTKREVLFAFKAGILTCLAALPAVIRSSAEFYYYNRGLWVIVMCQLTLSLYAGETAMAWISRAQGTFFGCLVGMLLWYIGEGGGHANPYGLGATCAVAFPMVFAVRLYYPASPLTTIIFTVSVGLVVGYSWINATLIQATNATWGWDVAWRRFVTVLIGITAAWIFAMLPPTSSGKSQIRQTYSRIISQTACIWTAIINEANDPNLPEQLEQHVIRDRVLAMKRKLAKTGARQGAIQYEFSLAGRWPIERYQALHDVLVDITALLSQLHHVLVNMPYPWRRALLQRIRMLDTRFLGECLAVMSMCSASLRAGTPLPQITPGPLVERLLQRQYGVAVTLDVNESKDIPHLVTSDVLKSEEYLHYALATTTGFSIIRRFDKLLLIVKTLVGEEFHIDLDLQEKVN